MCCCSINNGPETWQWQSKPGTRSSQPAAHLYLELVHNVALFIAYAAKPFPAAQHASHALAVAAMFFTAAQLFKTTFEATSLPYLHASCQPTLSVLPWPRNTCLLS
jgi:hypothetical protein